MSQHFCKSLSNAISIRIPGTSNTLTFNPCCLYEDYYPFHKTIYEKTRIKFLKADTFLPECKKCKLKEKTHGLSLRTASNQEIPDNLGDKIYKLEVVLDTTCNAACIQCSDTQSSLWRKEIAQDKKILHIQPEDQIDKRLDELVKIVDLSNVKLIHFWGGEPLLTNTHLKVIDMLSDHKDIQIVYTTNGSIFPKDEVLKIWEKFKKVKIGISIDGIGDKFDYIRWPLTWDKIKRNLELFKTESTSNSYFHVNCCILPLNVYYVNDLENWLSDNFSQIKNESKVTHNFIRGEGVLDITYTPMKLRDEVQKKFPSSHPIFKILEEVPVLDHSDMIKYLDYWDSRRKLNWRATFKEVAEYFN